MDLIARIYTEYQDYLRSKRRTASKGLPNEEIEFNMMLEIPKYVNKKEYGNLDRALGAALPEIDENRYYKWREIKKKDELNFINLRNIITWQLWITHFRDFFPGFRKDVVEALEASTQYVKIKQFIFDRNRDYADLSPNDLGIYIFNKDKPLEPAKPTKAYKNALRLYEKEKDCKEKDYKLLGELNKEDRELWWLRRMLERFASKKKSDVLCYQDIMGQNPLREIKLPKNVLHLLQFLTYVSTTEVETRESMVILNGLKDRTDEKFIATVKSINHIAFILGKAHAKLIKDFCNSWTEDFCKKHRKKYDRLVYIKRPGKTLVVKRLDYVLKKCYYEQAMKFLAAFGCDPSYETHCIEQHNKILKETIDLFKNGNFDVETFFKKYMWNEQQPQHWDSTCKGTTNIFFNFLTWHLEKEIETQKIGDNLLHIMDSMMHQMNEEENTNLLKYDAYMVKEWNIFEIGQKLFGIDTNKGNEVNICIHLQNHADSKQETKKKRRKDRDTNEKKKKKQKSIFIDDEATAVNTNKTAGNAEENITVIEDDDENENNNDENNKIDEQNKEQQEVQEVGRKTVNELTDIRNVHDMLIYIIKHTFQRLKTVSSEDLHAEQLDKLLYDVGELELFDASAKIGDIKVGKMLADWIAFNGV